MIDFDRLEQLAAHNAQGNFLPQRFDPATEAYARDPHAMYDHYRTHDPVHWGVNMDPNAPRAQGGWYVFRHADVTQVFKDPRVRSSMPQYYLAQLPPAERPGLEQMNLTMLTSDPPLHTRLRTLVNKAFTPQAVQRLEPRIHEIATWLLDEVNDHGKMDFVRDVAFPLPIIVITELLGLPPEDRDQFKHWSAMFMNPDQTPLPGQTQTPEDQATVELSAYIMRSVEQRRQRPGPDLLSAMITAENAGMAALTDDEIVAMTVLLLVAGHETTVNLMGNGLLELFNAPDQWHLLRTRTDDLIGPAVEEILRHVGPVTIGSRYAGEDLELGGRQIHAGELIFPVLDAANHDPAQFPDPQRFDITRPRNRHLAFGMGIHFCLGAPLARLETEIVFRHLVRRMPDLRLEPDVQPVPAASFLRGWASIPVGWTPQRTA